MKQTIQMEKQKLIEQLEKVQEIITHSPEGRLTCTSSNGSPQYFINNQYLGAKNRELAKEIAQRDYCIKLQRNLEQMIRLWTKIEPYYTEVKIDSCYNNLCLGRKKLVEPIQLSIEEQIQRFLSEEYEKGEFDADNTTAFYTIKGERVRSKSEVIIADELYRYHIPYQYEKPLILTSWGKEIVFRPDFTTINPKNGEIYIFEHFGMMDNLDYSVKNMRKLELYEMNGFLLGKNLIITHETSKNPLNIRILDSYIENFFL